MNKGIGLTWVRWRKLQVTILTDVPKFEYYKDDYSSVESIVAKFGPGGDGSGGAVKTNYPFFLSKQTPSFKNTKHIGEVLQVPYSKRVIG